jgi:endonuclease YncB( thermonuclease family)
MIRVRCQWAKRKGYARAFTYTAVDNVASSKNLVREGFEPYWPPPEVTTVIGPGFHYFAKLL